MAMYRIFGVKRLGEKERWICNMRADSAEEALDKARRIYGSLFVNGVQGFNGMCDNCAKLGAECSGSVSQVWTGCAMKAEA